jgi:hypothetical protein
MFNDTNSMNETGQERSIDNVGTRAVDKPPPPGRWAKHMFVDDQMMWQARPCMAEVAGVETGIDQDTEELITRCLTPDRTSPDHPTQTLFLLGDCHSAVILPALSLAVRGVYQIRHVYSDSVGLFPHRVNLNEAGSAHTTGGLHGGASTDLGRFIDVYEHILLTLKTNMKPGDAVMVSMFGGNWKTDNRAIARARGVGAVIVDLDLTPVDVLERDLLEGIVNPIHGNLFVMGDWPYFSTNSGDGTTPPQGSPTLTEADVEKQADLQTELGPLILRHTRIRYLSAFPLFCQEGMLLDNNWTTAPRGACSWYIPGTPIQAYSNDNHLSTVGSIYMWPYLCDELT